MKSNKEPSPIAVVWEWAGAYHAKFYAAVLLAVLGVAGTMLSYFSIAQIIRLLLEEQSMSLCWKWCIALAGGYLVKSVCSSMSTALSHTATYHTLRDIRKKMLSKLSRLQWE